MSNMEGCGAAALTASANGATLSRTQGGKGDIADLTLKLTECYRPS